MDIETADKIAALQRQVFTLLLALIVVSGTLTAYLWHEERGASGQLFSENQIIESVSQNQPLINSLANQLAAYGKTHPDILPLLAKYAIGPNGIAPAPAPQK